MDLQCYSCGGRGHKKSQCPSYNAAQGSIRSHRYNSSRRSINVGAEALGNRNEISSETQDRKYFDYLTKNPEADIRSETDAIRFFQAACHFRSNDKSQIESNEELLYRFVDEVGTLSLKKALQWIRQDSKLSSAVFVKGFIPFLELLGSDNLQKPALEAPLRQLLKKIYLFRLNITKIIHHHCMFHQNDVDKDKASLFAWFFTQITISNDEVGKEARSNVIIGEICNILSIYRCTNDLETILDRQAHDLENTDSDNVDSIDERFKPDSQSYQKKLSNLREEAENQPGGRNDNDFENFRDISIIPTKNQMICNMKPYIPTALNKGCNVGSVARHLDRTFRLYHEDMIGPMREILLRLKDPKMLGKELRYTYDIIEAESIAHRELLPDNTSRIARHKSHPVDPCIKYSFQIPTWHRLNKMKSKQEKMDFWKNSRRSLPKDSLVAFLRINAEGFWEPIRFGVIASRNIEDLVREKGNDRKHKQPLIGISFFNGNDLQESILEMSNPHLPPTKLLMASNSYFTYAFVLGCLQSIHSIPFEKELVQGSQSELQEYFDVSKVSILIKQNQPLCTELERFDTSQLQAFDAALNHRVALVQGPPGTGKTLLGAVLVQTLLKITGETILCVCYTNHALDSFLENLIDSGIKEIVRVGGKSKSEKVKPFSLLELSRSSEHHSFSKEATKRYAKLHNRIEEAEENINRHEYYCKIKIGEKWWRDVCEHLQVSDQDAFIALNVFKYETKDNDGFKVVDKHGKTIEPDYLWKRWLKGDSPSELFRNRKDHFLWKLSKSERNDKKIQWQNEMFEEDRNQLANLIKIVKDSREELMQLKDGTCLDVLLNTRIIGCTTTGAAKYHHLLKTVRAGVVLIEEAAEIMEAHVLTTLSSGCKHLIMIGDHKQLRPKAEHFPLTVEARRGFDLNKSLFERLASSIKVMPLTKQWRMHPQIAKIPKIVTYPELINGKEDNDFPNMKGLQDGISRVIFIDHRELEDQKDAFEEKVEAVSKTNKHEVQMAAAIVKYMLQQGYLPENMVVLTPYLGQLLKLKEALTKVGNVFVGNQDYDEAKRLLDDVAGFTVGGPSGELERNDGVRVATVDNYQGEEADVVIISVVRSNKENNIGFLREPERVNVMLSRAKHCEIIIGNSQVLQNAKSAHAVNSGGPLWKNICQHLMQTNAMHYGFPARCQTHPDQKTYLKTALDFESKCSAGGCSKICNNRLHCGHFCSQRCHASVGICTTPCSVVLDRFCPKESHPLKMKCGGTLPECKTQVEWRCNGNEGQHRNLSPCYSDKRECKTCIEIERIKESIEKERCREERERMKWEKELEIRNKVIEEKRKLAEEKRGNFKKKRDKKLQTQMAEISLRQQEREQKILEENSTDEIASLLLVAQKESDEEIKKKRKKIESQFLADARAVERLLETLETEKQVDLADMEQKRKDEANVIAQVRQQMHNELENLRDRAKAENDAMEEKTRKEIESLQITKRRQEVFLNKQILKTQRNISNAAILAKKAAEEKCDCIVCFESVRRIDGYSCAVETAHFTCDECLAGHITAVMQENLGTLEERGGRVACPGCVCKCKAGNKCEASHLDEETIMYHTPSVWKLYSKARKDLMTHQLSKKIRDEEKKRVEEERVRFEKLDAEEREIRKHHTYITEKLLNLACPQCKTTFLDFDGCFALKCRNCPCGFCAMCLEDCGDDAHRHVGHCREGGQLHQGVYGTKAEIDNIQKRRRERLVREYLQTIPNNIRGNIAQRCQKEFQDLGFPNIVIEFGGRDLGRR